MVIRAFPVVVAPLEAGSGSWVLQPNRFWGGHGGKLDERPNNGRGLSCLDIVRRLGPSASCVSSLLLRVYLTAVRAISKIGSG